MVPVTLDGFGSKGHRRMRRGEVLLVIGESTGNEQRAADTIQRDQRLWGTVQSGDAGNCEAARCVRRRGSNSARMATRDCPLLE
jgi:hypothetical protein